MAGDDQEMGYIGLGSMGLGRFPCFDPTVTQCRQQTVVIAIKM